ncbi:MAG: T9SS type A sorting domain-containing protein [Bacteroidales bacterium]|nr:T9SS type A sorting domain-containing protein [Bacteroidales bacterium]
MKNLSILFLCMFVFNLAEAQTIYYVSKKGSDSNDGKSWASAFLNPQTAIDAAGETDQVWVAEGTYYPTCSLNGREDDVRAKSFKIGKSMFRIYGGFSGTEQTIDERKQADLDGNGTIEPWEFVHETILSGDIDGKPDVWTWNEKTKRWNVENNENNVYTVIHFSGRLDFKYGETVLFDGFSITGGNANASFRSSGGGIWDEYENYRAFITRCKIYKNSAIQGGGVYGKFGIKKCAVFHNCASSKFGGIYSMGEARDSWIYRNSAMEDGGGCSDAYNSRIFSNYAKNGGGVSVGTIADCVVYNNEADVRGGGTYGVDIRRSRIYNNRAPIGGAVSCSEYVLSDDISNSLIFNNSSGVYGKSLIDKCTVANNGTESLGSLEPYSCRISNSIFWNEDCHAETVSCSAFSVCQFPGSSNIQLEDCPFMHPTSFRGVAVTPEQVRELENSDWRLLPGSPCIDAGEGVEELGWLFDVDSVFRPQHAGLDMGAHEYVFQPSDAVEMPFLEDFEKTPLSVVTGLQSDWTCGKLSGKEGMWFRCQYSYNNWFSTPYFLPEDTVATLSYDLVLEQKYTFENIQLYVWVGYMGEDSRDTIAIHKDIGKTDTHYTHRLPEKCSYTPFYISFKKASFTEVQECALDNIVVKGHNYHVGMADVEEKKIRIYPNPFVDVFYIDEEEGTRIAVYDLGGTPVYEGLVTSTPHSVESSRWRPGSYLISLTGKDGQKSWKAVKK